MEPKDWKDHPVIILAAAFAAGAALAISTLIPIYTTVLQNKNAELQNQLSAEKARNLNIDKLKQAYRSLNNKYNDIRHDLLVAENKNVFSGKNPYPIGVGHVKLGDSVDKIILNYDSNSIELEKDKRYYAVYNQHNVFKSIYYFFNGNKTVEGIIFDCAEKNDRYNWGQQSAPSGVCEKYGLLNILTREFGQPSSQTVSGQVKYLWNINSEYHITMIDLFSFNLHKY